MKRENLRNFLAAAFAGTLAALFAGCAGTPRGISPVYTELTRNPCNLSRLAELARKEPGARTPDGESCLRYAIVCENYDAAEVLAANGARLDREELYALFEPFRKNTKSNRFKFLSPIFPNSMTHQELYYSCVAGDTPNRIAKKLGCTAKELRELNPDVDFAKLKRGQKLRRPARSR